MERKDGLRRRVADIKRRCERAVVNRCLLDRARVEALARAEGLLRFPYRLREWRERVGQSRGELAAALARRPTAERTRLLSARAALSSFARVAGLDRQRQRLVHSRSLLEERTRRRLDRQRARLSASAEKLGLVSPLSVLARGYAVAYREGSESPLLSARRVRPGDGIRIRLHEGEIRAVARQTSAPADPGPLFSVPPAKEEDAMTARVKKEKSFEEAMARLEEIVGAIESEELGLERQFELFEEGMRLARFCDGKLSDVQKSVEIVLKEAAGEWKTAPFESDEGPGGDGDDDRD